MINIKNQDQCCGCSACVQKCPKQCITLVEDREGFLYPNIDNDNCVDCGCCNNVCPINSKEDSRRPLQTYAAINPEESVRRNSSSGGLFYSLAEYVLLHNGVVFGARFDEKWNVVHDYAEDIEGTKCFMGSKYVQSNISYTYSKAKEFLETGRLVLFSGSPCQVGGLRSFLMKEYYNLICVDFICHGAPSPGVWKKYIKEISTPNKLSHVTFRDKIVGWNQYSLTLKDYDNKIIYTRPFREDPYMQLFLQNITLRPSCYDCKFRHGKSGSDITLADFWHIDRLFPDMYDDKGASMLLVNTKKGESILRQLFCNLREAPFDSIENYNKAWSESYSSHTCRNYFFDNYNKKSIIYLYKKIFHPELLLKNRIKHIIHEILKFWI